MIKSKNIKLCNFFSQAKDLENYPFLQENKENLLLKVRDLLNYIRLIGKILFLFYLNSQLILKNFTWLKMK